MAVAPSDLALMLSIPAAAGGALVPQPNPHASLGKWVSTSTVDPDEDNNIFDNITGVENAAGTSDYRCLFVQNNHATLTAIGVTAWLYSQISGGATVSLGVDPTAASAKGATSIQAATSATQLTAPAGVSFSTAASSGTAIALGDIPAGHVRALWIKRTAANSAPLDTDGFVIEIDFDTRE